MIQEKLILTYYESSELPSLATAQSNNNCWRFWPQSLAEQLFAQSTALFQQSTLLSQEMIDTVRKYGPTDTLQSTMEKQDSIQEQARDRKEFQTSYILALGRQFKAIANIAEIHTATQGRPMWVVWEYTRPVTGWKLGGSVVTVGYESCKAYECSMD